MIKIEFKDNPDYRPAFTSEVHNVTFYEPVSDVSYHNSRYVAAGAHNYYCAAGITKELLLKMLEQMEAAVNSNKLSDIAVLINNLKYRTRYPVDEDAAIRLALIFYFIPGENPDTVEPHWIEHKLKLVKEDPAAYSFFMSIGIKSSPIYNGLDKAISPTSLQNRRNDLEGLTLQP
jgi:hypothetical protein